MNRTQTTRPAQLRQLVADLPLTFAGDGLTLRRLDLATSIIEEAERYRADLVDLARTEGATWTEIGRNLGMTKQAAQKRYGRKPAPATDERQPTLPL